jgi:hypothetical protein
VCRIKTLARGVDPVMAESGKYSLMRRRLLLSGTLGPTGTDGRNQP